MTESAEILFVDDEKNVLKSLKRIFLDENYIVNVADSGEEALEVLKKNPEICLIVSDQRMPGLTGVDFLEKAKDISPDSLRILLTGYADINAVVDAINRGGAYRYITKPWIDDELQQIIAEAVQRYSLTRENKRLQGIVKKQNEELKNWNSQLEYFVQEQTLQIQKKNNELQALNENLRKSFKNTIVAFSSLLALRDRGTRNHSKNVAEIAVKMAKAMGLSSSDIESIAVAALLHDIGKIGMPDIILLLGEDDMTAEEKKEYRQHPVRGQAAIDSVEDLRSAGVLIRHHHEWDNGSGFPDGLSGGKIPIGAKIISIADYFERAVSKIDAGDAVKIALAKVKKEVGTRFDKQIYPVFRSTVKEIYSRGIASTGMQMVEKELGIDDLKVGMVLSRDVKSGTGLTLLTKDIKLNEANIQTLKRYRQLDPSNSGIFVMVEGKND